MKNNLIRKIIGGLSFTSALFIFQACYGTPQDMLPDVLVEGQVKSAQSQLPLQGIKVLVNDGPQFEITDNDGNFSFYTFNSSRLTLKFQDVDSLQNGLYAEKDTTLKEINEKVYLDIRLNEK